MLSRRQASGIVRSMGASVVMTARTAIALSPSLLPHTHGSMPFLHGLCHHMVANGRSPWHLARRRWRTVAAGLDTLHLPMSREERRLKQLHQVAELIRAARQRAGLTQEELAARMTRAGEPTSRSQVSMWELGSPSGHVPSTGKLLAIFEVTRSGDPVRDEAKRQIARLEAQLAELRRQLSS